MWGPGSNEGAYDYSPFPGTSIRQQTNLKNYDKKYKAAAEKLQKQGYVVQGDHYFKRVPDANKPGGYSLVKAGRVETGHNNEALKVAPAKPQKPPVTAKPSLDPNGSNGARGENRSGVKPVNGSFRTAVEQGPDGDVTPSSGNAGGAQSTDPQGSGYIAPTATTGGSKEKRVNANGLVSYGRDLSSLNQFTRAFTGGYELTDIKSSFQSNDLQGAYQNGSNTISTDESKYTLPDGATPSNVGGKYTMDGVDTSIQSTGYQISDKSVPGTVGGNPADPQDGTSDKPDVAENIRQVRMRRKGPRDEGSFRGFQIDQANEMAQTSVSNTKGNGQTKLRRDIVSTFLNHEGNSVQAVTAARAVAGVGNDSNGDDVYNVDGKLVYAKPGEERKAINTLMSGHNPMAHLDVPATGDTQPDTPAASELSPTPASTVKPGTIQMPENNGGSLETPAPILKPSPAKQKEAEDFMSSHLSMLTRKTK